MSFPVKAGCVKSSCLSPPPQLHTGPHIQLLHATYSARAAARRGTSSQVASFASACQLGGTLAFLCGHCRSTTTAVRRASGRQVAAAAMSQKRKTPNIPGMMERVKECNSGLERASEFLKFMVASQLCGFTHKSFAERLRNFPDVFRVDEAAGIVSVHERWTSMEERSDAVAQALEVLREDGTIPGWRNELFDVSAGGFNGPTLLRLERAATHLLGIKVYGAHVNGFVLDEGGGTKQLWVAKRSPLKPTHPNKLDHLVAGGVSTGISCRETVIKEAEEEADLPAELAARAISVGAISYETIVGIEMQRVVLFCYDLEMPRGYKPKNVDGEVHEFMLLPVEAVMEIVQSSSAYKPNCSLVVIDFLIRHGYITPDDVGYLDLFYALRGGANR